MPVKRIERRGSFVARDEKGIEYTIYIFLESHYVFTRENPRNDFEYRLQMRTKNGESVYSKGKGIYVIQRYLGRDVVVYSEDSNSP